MKKGSTISGAIATCFTVVTIHGIPKTDLSCSLFLSLSAARYNLLNCGPYAIMCLKHLNVYQISLHMKCQS